MNKEDKIIEFYHQARPIIIALLGGVVVFFTKVLTTYAGELLVTSFFVAVLAFVIGALIKDEKKISFANEVGLIALIFTVFSGVGLLVARCILSNEKEKNILYEATMDMAAGKGKDIPWMTDTDLETGKVCFIVTPKGNNPKEDYYNIMREILPYKTFNLFVIDKLPNIAFLSNPVQDHKYNLIIIDKSYLKGKLSSQYRILPQSVSWSILGERNTRVKDWEAARHFFEKADAEGNAYATYMLARMLEDGYGLDPDLSPDSKQMKKARTLKKKAAEMGFQLAQCEWAKDILHNGDGSRSDIATAEEFLTKSTKLLDYRNETSLHTLWDATYELIGYYYITKDVLRSYFLTRRLCKDYPFLYYPKMEHARNCLAIHHYSKAKKLMAECEKQSAEIIKNNTLEYVFIDHADMYIRGKGEKKNIAEGERLLRYAADKLNYYPAWKELWELYENKGFSEEAAFCKQLYELKYSNCIEE